MKIQVLELPMQHAGEYSTTPYALIISEAPDWETAGRYADRLTPLISGIRGPSYIISTVDEVEL